MGEERLLDRIRSLEREPLRRGSYDRALMLDSIVTHLSRLLNTRQGGVPIAADYGVPDFLHFLQNFPDSVREIELAIRKTIEFYEPRLRAVEVEFLPTEQDALALRFAIHAQVVAEPASKVRFESMLASDGRISVRR